MVTADVNDLQSKQNIIDWEELLGRLGGETSLLGKLIEIFEEDNLQRIAEIKKAFDESDCKRIAEFAHTIKGSSLNLTAREVAESAKAIEVLAREGQLADLPSLIYEIEKSLVDSVNELKKHLK